MTGCSFCGKPIDDVVETHHDDHTKDDTDPDNLRPAHRRCHMRHHENDRAVDEHSETRFGPTSPSTAPPRPTGGPP